MDSKIEIDARTLECLRWAKGILLDHGLLWKINWTPQDHRDGITMFKTKKILVHWPPGEPDYALMAHEIAHAIYGKPGHDSEFAHQYMNLVRTRFTANCLLYRLKNPRRRK